MWSKFNFLAIGFLVATVGSLTLGMCTACKSTYKVYWDERIPPECNMSLNTIKIIKEGGLPEAGADKSFAVLPVDKCYRKLAMKYCIDLVYKKAELYDSGEDITKYKAYQGCLKEHGF